ncbi:MAG: hypothetical protein GY749_02205 [Desulfobacteraceae bacterium]|nr:hypothetical protein [Desulfobacteraceae bacterium]
MKKVIVCIIVFMSAITWGQEYPNPTMEQVDINPEGYTGLTVKFMGAAFKPNPTLFNAPDNFEDFDDKFYTYIIYSKGSVTFFVGPNPNTFKLSFYSSQILASALVNSGLDLKTKYNANIICQIEKTTGKSFVYKRDEPYYLCRIYKIEQLDDEGTIVATYEDEGELPLNPLEKWDIGLDGKIGLEEAIRALQITAGSRESEK